MRRALLAGLAVPFVLGIAALAPHDRALFELGFHDNTTSAGEMIGGELVVALEIRRGLWRPNGPTQHGTPVLAFVERGRPAMLPGPLLRVPVGTVLRVSVTNTLDTTLTVHGLGSAPAAPDSFMLGAGDSREVRFVADAEGNRFYYGKLPGNAFDDIRGEDGHLTGAFIVDPPGARSVQDKVLLISASAHSRDSTGAFQNDREVIAINGRPWPFTQRLSVNVRDSLHFRVINASFGLHPMHLHGAYFRVDARGDLTRDTIYAARDRRMAVTESLSPGTTMSMSWSPERPGTWMFHCHLTWHTIPNPLFGPDSQSTDVRYEHAINGHPGHNPHNHVVEGMGGLMMAITVPPPAGWSLPETARRELRFVVPGDSTASDSLRYFAPSLTEGAIVTSPVARNGPGAPLVLRQGEPTTIRVVNESPDPTSIHWHGMELESLYDGVVGLGGTPGRNTLAVLPRDSFDVRMTPPRAGTFIYHTHFMELRQTTGGLFGSMIVLPPGEEWDESRDHVFIVGAVRRRGVTLNGGKTLPTLELEAGVNHRLRLINITIGNPGMRFHLTHPDSSLVEWTLLAKDGMDLPEHQQRTVPARRRVAMGETYDMGFKPGTPGHFRLELRFGDGRLAAHQPIRVVTKHP